MKIKIVFLWLMLLVSGSICYSQQISTDLVSQDKKKVSGIVLDAETFEPIIGANVVTIPLTIATTTDVDGKFTIICDSSTKQLSVSFIGYLNDKVQLNNTNESIKVFLKQNSQQLSEVVVTGIQTIERGRATGAYNIVKPEDMSHIYSTNISEKLEGTTPGLFVDKDNNITIRGLGSLNASTRPLYVVDGFPLESSELNLNPNDIEQISVLKDAASASIWGIRAANGVIVITTKRGRTGNTKVSYSGNLTFGKRPDWGDLHLLSSDQYVANQFSIVKNMGSFTSVCGGLTELESIASQYNNGNISIEEAWNSVRELGKFNNSRQITQNFYRPSFTQQHNIALNAGNENISTFLSLNFDQDKTVLVGNDYHKFNLLSNTDFYLHKAFKVSVGIRGTYKHTNNNGIDMTSYEPWKRILNDDGSYYNEQYAVSNQWDNEWQSLGLTRWEKNSLETLKLNDNSSKDYNLSSSLRLNWAPIKGLDIMVQGNYEFGNTHNDIYYSQDHYNTRYLTNIFTEVEIENGHPVSILNTHLPTSGGMKGIFETHLSTYSIRDVVSYTNGFQDFEYKVLVGNEVYSIKGNTHSNWLFGFDPELLTSQSINWAALQEGVTGYNGNIQNLSGIYAPTYAETINNYVSYFGTGNITYKNTYDLFGSIRLDQTNLLTNSNKFRNNPSWSVGGKWNISNENFLRSANINLLSLRMSYGLSGNIDKSTGPDIVVEASSDWNIPSLNYLIITNPANPALGWEKTCTWNIGVDYSFWNRRLSGSIDFYNKYSNGLLANVDNDPTTGWAGLMKNSAKVRNTGIDMLIQGKILTCKDFYWDAMLNFSYNYNKVTELNYVSSPKGMCKGNPIKGHSIGTIAAIRYGGLDDNGEPTFLKKDDDKKYSWNQLYLLDVDDLIYAGSVVSPVFGSLSTNFRYKDFTLGLMFTYQFGGKMHLPSPAPTFGLYSEWFDEKFRWVDGQDNTNKWVPTLFPDSDIQPMDRRDCLHMSDKMIDKSDAIYFKSISLTYDASRWLKYIGLSGATISISGENLTYWAANKYKLDPNQMELGQTDFDYVCGFTKSPKLVLGLNINF